MDISQQSQMYSVLALSYLKSLVEKETPDSSGQKKFQAFWVMYALHPLPSFFLFTNINVFHSNMYSFYQAWRLWREEKLQDLMDPSLSDSYNVNQFIRCAQIALLCVQDEPDDRPHMSNVVTMLDNETTTLLTPKQPTFFSRKEISSTASSSLQIESSIQEGR
jgi:hypothetical protein